MIIAPWLIPPNFLEAAQAGAQIGLAQRRQAEEAADALRRNALGYAQLAAENSRSDAENQQRQEQQSAELELRREALNQAGLLGSERNKNEANALSARTELEKERLGKPTFANTGSGLFERDPKTGQWSSVPGTERPVKSAGIKIAVGNDLSGRPLTQTVPMDKLKDVLRSLPAGWSENPYNKAALATIPKDVWYDSPQPTSAVSAADELKAPSAPASAGYFSLGSGGETNPTDLPLPDTQNPSIYPPPESVLPKFKAGQRAVQGGVTYEFDGDNWNEVKQ